MTEWKAGDWAMVKIVCKRASAIGYRIQASCGQTDFIGRDCLHPLPAPLTKLERDIVEAAVAWRNYSVGSYNVLAGAVDALIAARMPPDPVKELRAAWDDFRSETAKPGGADMPLADRVASAIAAVEAQKS